MPLAAKRGMVVVRLLTPVVKLAAAAEVLNFVVMMGVVVLWVILVVENSAVLRKPTVVTAICAVLVIAVTMEAVALPAKAAARKRDAVLSAKNAVVMAAVTMTIPAVRTDYAVHQIIQYVVREANAVQRVLSAVKLAVAEGEVKISYLLSQEKPRRRKQKHEKHYFMDKIIISL